MEALPWDGATRFEFQLGQGGHRVRRHHYLCLPWRLTATVKSNRSERVSFIREVMRRQQGHATDPAILTR